MTFFCRQLPPWKPTAAKRPTTNKGPTKDSGKKVNPRDSAKSHRRTKWVEHSPEVCQTFSTHAEQARVRQKVWQMAFMLRMAKANKGNFDECTPARNNANTTREQDLILRDVLIVLVV